MSKYLAGILEQAGIPVARNAFKKTQSPPYIVYLFAYSNNFSADSGVYLKRSNYQVELYTAKKDTALEEKLEGIFHAEGIYYDKTEVYLDSEDLLEAIYEIQLLEGSNYV